MDSKTQYSHSSLESCKNIERPACLTKPKLCAAVVLILGLAAIAGACAVAAMTLLPAKSRNRGNTDQEMVSGKQ
jgi:hypothetical protein